MTLAELGQYAEAAAVQRGLVALAEHAGLADTVVLLAGNLARYERGEPCRTPGPQTSCRDWRRGRADSPRAITGQRSSR